MAWKEEKGTQLGHDLWLSLGRHHDRIMGKDNMGDPARRCEWLSEFQGDSPEIEMMLPRG
jgi:hypothetical protein